MDREQTLKFARALMKQVWEPFDSSAVERFYHRDVVGHHRRPNETQELAYADVVNRLDWDKQTNANAIFDYRDIIAEEGKYLSGTLTGRTTCPKATGGCKIGTPRLPGGRSTWR